MSNEKPTLTREQANAIECVKNYELEGIIVEKVATGKPIANPNFSALNTLDLYTLMRALVNGYEIEKSPEEKLREYYESSLAVDRSRVIEKTLSILGITIEGINDK